MKLKILYIFLIFLTILAGTAAILFDYLWLQKASQIFIVFPLFGFFFPELRSAKLNFYGFVVSFFVANVATVLNEFWYFSYVAVGFWLVCFGFLLKEAIQYTSYSKGTRVMRVYFSLVVAVYIYLLVLHLIELESNVIDRFQFFMYVLYYFNLLVLGVAALIYYLNSFSRKSVYFICFVLALIFSDVLRDMGIFYFRDVSVEIVGTLIKFSAFILIFLFYTTEEKKLRLLNLL